MTNQATLPTEPFFSRLRRAFGQLGIKITLPYAILALIVAFLAAFLVTRLLASVLENRFETALMDAGRMAADAMVRVEREQLAAWRVIAYTEGLAQAVAEGNQEQVTLLATPHLVNSRLDCLEVLNAEGKPILSLHHTPGGSVTDYVPSTGANYVNWEIVDWVLAGEADEIGDKYADLIETDWGWVFYTSGPIRYNNELVGVLLVGSYIDRVATRLSEASLARISIYPSSGAPLVTTLSPDDPAILALDDETFRRVLEQQEQQVIRRDVTVAERGYAEVFGAFEARHGGRDMGVFSVALPLSFVTDARAPTRTYLLGLFGAATALVILTGALVANAVVRRVRQLAHATARVAQGDLSTRVNMPGYDEVATLAQDFDRMVTQLREGRLYRDLMGLTLSSEVAEKLRQGLQNGRIQLEAQSVVATVLFADIRGFSRIAEMQEPHEVIRFLNDYLHGLITIIREHNGVINKFAGDAALAFFGVLPEPRPPAQSAQDALAAALKIEDYLVDFNRRRREQGQEPIRVGIGVNTGLVVVGTLGSEEQFEYTIIGDTVNIAQRLSDLNKEFTDYDLFIGSEVYRLADEAVQARAVHLGRVHVKGRVTAVEVYAVKKEHTDAEG